MDLLIWVGFFSALCLIMVISKKSLWLGMCIGALYLGIFSPGLLGIPDVVIETFTNPSILLLALAVGIIPLIGGAMERAGLMDDLVNNLRMKKRAFLATSPALIGLLPMPGGALLSAPLVEKGGKGVPNVYKSAINVWYRHLLILIYPLGGLLATTKAVGLNLYIAVIYIIPGFLVLFFLGQFFFIRKVEGSIRYRGKFKGIRLAVPLFIVIVAPVLHICLMKIFPHLISEIPLVIGVTASLIIAFHFARLGPGDILPVARKMKPWNYALIIIGMFLFLNMFKASAAPDKISSLEVPTSVLLVGVGAFLGFAMGRIIGPVFILYPIYETKFGTITLIPFTIMYFAVFIGYVVSPIHPCLVVTQEYFKVSYRELMKRMLVPASIALAIGFLAGIILL